VIWKCFACGCNVEAVLERDGWQKDPSKDVGGRVDVARANSELQSLGRLTSERDSLGKPGRWSAMGRAGLAAGKQDQAREGGGGVRCGMIMIVGGPGYKERLE
jgi:hypothetical protein